MKLDVHTIALARGFDHPDPWPAPPSTAAYSGILGEIANEASAYTEADPVAMLAQAIAAFGNVIGPRPHCMVSATPHRLNLFVAIVGDSAKARKGDSWSPVRWVFSQAIPEWVSENIVSGLSSGEGLISEVRDSQTRPGDDGIEVTVAHGVDDKRRLVMEPEFGRVLRVGQRNGNIVSSVIREAWDSGELRTLVKASPLRATGAHISIAGHITQDELRRELTDIEAVNGFANRFLWFLVRRSQLLPDPDIFGGPIANRLAISLRKAIDHARGVGLIRRDDVGTRRWREIYPALAEAQPGLAGSVLARAEAQVLRLSAVYALASASRRIRAVDIDSAYDLWQYVERSVRHIFGDATGDPIADRILRALRDAGGAGLTRTEISGLLDRHVSAERIETALVLLERHRKARANHVPTGGRPQERWAAT